MASVKLKLNQRLKLKLTQLFCTALTVMVWDTMVMVLAMVITMERGKLNLLLKLKLTLLFSTAPMDMVSVITAMLDLDITVMLVLDTLAMLALVIMDMVLAMATMASVQHRWCNTFSCHSVRAWRESYTSI